MKRFFVLIGGVSLLGLLGGCSDFAPDSNAAQEDQIDRATTVPGVEPTDSLGAPGATPVPQRVPGE